MNLEYKFIVSGENSGERIDKYLSTSIEELSRSAAAALIENGGAEVNGKTAAKNYKLRSGDEITVNIPEPRKLETEPENIPLDIIYEDEDLLVGINLKVW